VKREILLARLKQTASKEFIDEATPRSPQLDCTARESIAGSQTIGELAVVISTLGWDRLSILTWMLVMFIDNPLDSEFTDLFDDQFDN